MSRKPPPDRTPARRRPAPTVCPSCAATCLSATERHTHRDCRDARKARKRNDRPR